MSKRIPHTLQNLKRISFPDTMIFFDVESEETQLSDDMKLQKARLITAVYIRRSKNKEEWIQTTNINEFYNWLFSKPLSKKPLYIFAHNIYYDLKASDLIKEAINRGYEISKVYDNSGRGLILEMVNKNRKLVFIDTINYFNMSLKKLGKSIGLEKLDVDVFTDDINLLKEYNKRDVEIIKEAILKLFELLENEQLCGFAYTIAGLSLKAFRTKFLKHRIFIHANPEVDNLELKAYYGGRCEAFVINRVLNPVFKLDINSMYPFVMREYKYPINLIAYKKDIPIGVLKRYLRRGYLAIAKVMLNTPEPAYPYRKKDKLIFPIGRFITYLSTPELIYALKNNHIVKVYEVAIYKGEKIFKDYIDYFYNKRLEAKKEGNEAYAYFYKIFMNSLYGKFAQRVRKLEYKVKHDDVDYYKMKVLINEKPYDEIRVYNISLFISKEDELSNHSFPAIASHITAYARMYLYDLIKKAGFENVYYCDTDSLFVNEEGYNRLKDFIDDKELGKLKLEEVGECIIWGAKNYKFNETRKIKGIPKKSEYKDGAYWWWQFERWRSGFKYGLHDGVILKLAHRSIKSPYDKRIVHEDGSTEPIYLEECDEEVRS